MLSLFDFSAAFPSVSHAWIRAVLVCIQFPPRLLRLFDALYQDSEAYWECGGFVHWLFKVVSGVLQGCPLSATIFNWSVDPFLCIKEKYIDIHEYH